MSDTDDNLPPAPAPEPQPEPTPARDPNGGPALPAPRPPRE